MEEEKTSEAKETKVVNQEVEKTLSTSSCRQDKCKSNFYYRKEARKKPTDFESLKAQIITKVVKGHSLPPALILNLDKTATKVVATSE